MKRFFIALLLSVALFTPLTRAIESNTGLIVTINTNTTVEIEKNIIFDASSSVPLENENPISYTWDFGDGTKEEGLNVVHTYHEAGNYQVTLTLSQGDAAATTTSNIFVYKKLILLLTDQTNRRENIESLIEDAKKEGTYIYSIDAYDSMTTFMTEETLIKKITEQKEILNNTNTIISWTNGSSGINALSHLAQGEKASTDSGIQEAIQGKNIIIISEENLYALARILQVHFNIIHPQQIIITRESELKNLISAPTVEEFLNHLDKTLSEYKIINEETGKISVWNSISYLVNFMIVKGIPSNTIVLLLMLPVIATLIAFIKQIIGIKIFGLYLPSIITLSFLALGLPFGLTILITLIISGAILRKALDHFRLLHIPRVAIILTVSTFIIFLMLAAGTYFGINQIATIAVFPMLIMTSLAEKFASALSEKGILGAFILMVETTSVSLLCYWVVEWQFLQTLMLSHPEILLLLILINFGLGRWTGLRLLEYFRFREIMKHAEEE